MSLELTDYTGVFLLVNCYVPVHIESHQNTALSDQPEKDFEIAQTTAKIFAAQKSIPYKRLLLADRPFMGVAKKDGKWFPAQLHAKAVDCLENFHAMSLACDTEQQATRIAEAIAIKYELDFLPIVIDIIP